MGNLKFQVVHQYMLISAIWRKKILFLIMFVWVKYILLQISLWYYWYHFYTKIKANFISKWVFCKLCCVSLVFFLLLTASIWWFIYMVSVGTIKIYVNVTRWDSSLFLDNLMFVFLLKMLKQKQQSWKQQWLLQSWYIYLIESTRLLQDTL